LNKKTISTFITTDTIKKDMIAPCGMNCSICIGHLRQNRQCQGCNGMDTWKPYHCIICKIKNCEEMEGEKKKFCYKCKKYPCTRLNQLDKRYRTRYGMSMVENLEIIQNQGITDFIKTEKERWKCNNCGAIICVHRNECMNCRQIRK
jgi:hypothetical protein